MLLQLIGKKGVYSFCVSLDGEGSGHKVHVHALSFLAISSSSLIYTEAMHHK